MDHIKLQKGMCVCSAPVTRQTIAAHKENTRTFTFYLRKIRNLSVLTFDMQMDSRTYSIGL